MSLLSVSDNEHLISKAYIKQHHTHTPTYTHTHTCAHTHTHTHTHAHTHTHMHTHTHTHTHTQNTHTCLHTHARAHTHLLRETISIALTEKASPKVLLSSQCFVTRCHIPMTQDTRKTRMSLAVNSTAKSSTSNRGWGVGEGREWENKRHQAVLKCNVYVNVHNMYVRNRMETTCTYVRLVI